MNQTITLLAETRAASPVDKSEQAAASSAHSRINLPLDLNNWRSIDASLHGDLAWLHQHALDDHLSWDELAEALGYERSVVFRVLKGTYEGSWKNVVDSIRSYRRIIGERGKVQSADFVENGITRLIHGGLNYALANSVITLIEGESRMGKTTSAMAWRDANNHGRSVYVLAPAYGGTKALLRDIAGAVGVNKNLNAVQMHDAILRAFNRHRILIVDEAHRLLPSDRRGSSTSIEIVRDIHDRTGAAIALLSTTRFGIALKQSEYMYEQLLGRIELPVRLPRKVKREDVAPIVRQYIADPSEAVLDSASELANKMGRLGMVIGTLKVASRLTGGAKRRVTNESWFKALKVRESMMGEQVFASNN